MRTKLLGMILLTIVVCFVPLMGIIAGYTDSVIKEAVYREAELLARNNALFVENFMHQARSVGVDAAAAIKTQILAGVTNREAAQEYFRYILESNDTIGGIWSNFEPGCFDNKDEVYKDDGEYYDSTGVFQTWWYYSDGAVVYEMSDTSETVVEEYYTVPKETKRVFFADPYVDVDINVLMCTITVPVFDGDRFFGAVGVDLPLTDIEEVVSAIKPYETGYAALVTGNGTYAASGDESKLGKAFDGTADVLAAIKGGKEARYTEGNFYNVFIPVQMDAGTTWSIQVGVPLDRAMADANNLMVMTLSLAGAVLAVVAVVMILVSNYISRPIVRASMSARKLAGGDTGFETGSARRDEIGELTRDFDDVRRKMAGIIQSALSVSDSVESGILHTRLDGEGFEGEYSRIITGLNGIMDTIDGLVASIKVSARDVALSSGQIAEGSRVLAQGAAQQSSAIEEISAEISGLNDAIADNAGSTKDAKELSDRISAGATEADKEMRRLTVAVEEISAASSDVAKIIKTIEDIAFQTNILALNAAVEAARAGAHGRGFAVVAEEVRSLATKSAEAAKATGEIISKSLKKTREGVEISAQAEITIRSIVEDITETHEVISHIDRVSGEQAQSIAQIKQGIDQVSVVISNNTATAEESASQSQHMSNQADQLNNMVKGYVNSGEDTEVRLLN